MVTQKKKMVIGDVVIYEHDGVVMLGVITSDSYRTIKEYSLRSLKMLWTNGREKSDYWKIMSSLGDKHLTVIGNVTDHGVSREDVVTTYYVN